MQHRYQILKPDWIVTVNADFEVLQDYAVVIEDNRIQSLASIDEIRQLPCFAEALIIDLPGRVLMPGLVNSHTHASMSLLRGIADDMPLMKWLDEHIWPAEAKWVDAAFCVDGFQLAAAEMIRSGTTCMNDMYFFADEVARSAEQIGMRVVVGLIVLDFPSA
jgi:5-methylthioadenosine/S-adenosylhomocysteine deaminase